jgi:hypothetical protein
MARRPIRRTPRRPAGNRAASLTPMQIAARKSRRATRRAARRASRNNTAIQPENIPGIQAQRPASGRVDSGMKPLPRKAPASPVQDDMIFRPLPVEKAEKQKRRGRKKAPSRPVQNDMIFRPLPVEKAKKQKRRVGKKAPSRPVQDDIMMRPLPSKAPSRPVQDMRPLPRKAPARPVQDGSGMFRPLPVENSNKATYFSKGGLVSKKSISDLEKHYSGKKK